MDSQQQGDYTIHCRFCNETEITHIDDLAAHYFNNGCSMCQKMFNDNASRLLRTIDDKDNPGISLVD